MIMTAEVRVGGSSPYNNEGWILKSFRSPKLWIIIGISVLLLAGIATGVGIAFSSSSSSSSSNGDSDGIGSKPDSEFNPCDFSDTEQPDVFSQCACNGEISIFAKDSFQRYLEYENSIALELNPDFVAPDSSSCDDENLALAWLATDEYTSLTTDPVTLMNRYVLALLFQKWTGSQWNINTGWLSSTSECTWYGISCEDNAVVGMELGRNSLKSTESDNGLPVELFVLTSLRTFNVSGAALQGSIPSEIRSLVNLETLDLGSPQTLLGQYPDELFTLPNIRYLDIAYPTGGGTIPTYVGLLGAQLETFIASGGNLAGTLPAELGGATGLAMLALNSNGLSGPLPTELGLLQNLQHLDLAENLLLDTIPAELGNLFELRFLDLGRNAVRGSIPTEVAGLPSLQTLRLRENRFTGAVPMELLNSGNLLCFDASGNTPMENFIPQGQCIPDAETIAVACNNEDDPTCSCCECWRVGSIEYCTEPV